MPRLFYPPLAEPGVYIKPKGINNKDGYSIKVTVLYWHTGRDSNPQPSEPESDALSIEPPVHSAKLL